MKDLVIIMLLGFCQNAPGIYARKQQSASAKQMGILLFLSFIVLGTSAAITENPFCFTSNQDRFPNLSSVIQSVSVTLHHSKTGRHCGSESLTKEREGKFRRVPSSTKPEACGYFHWEFLKTTRSALPPLSLVAQGQSHRLWAVCTQFLPPPSDHSHAKEDLPYLSTFYRWMQDRKTRKVHATVPWAGFTVSCKEQ